jgi:glycosyltransferase involved in cell wall biosynthesis
MPQFSVVTPSFNRTNLLLRALGSCLPQAGAEFEVIVVDDGSTDDPRREVEALDDPRVKLLRHTAGKGPCAARNTGIDAASGEWIVFLDSDDELLPGALARMAEIIRGPGAGADRLAFMYRRDDGGVSPSPPLRDEFLDYPASLRALEGRRYFDFLQCTRRSTFAALRWPEWKYAGHVLYLTDFSQRFRTYSSSEFLAIVHTDAPERMSWQRRKPQAGLQSALELGEEMDLILARHGAALAIHAPHTLRRFQRVRASYHFLAGQRVEGVRQSLRCLREAPHSAETWLQLATGLAGPALFARIRSLRPPPT